MADPVYTQIKTKEGADIESCDEHNRSPSKDEITKKAPARRSCLRNCCCITLIIIGVLLSLLTGVVVASYVWFSHQVRTWTTTNTPVDDMPTVIVAADKLETFKHEVEGFENYLEMGVTDASLKPKPLVVSERHLNGLASDSDFLQGHSYTHLLTNEVTIDICLPMDKFPGGKGRYLVGKGSLVWDPDKSEIHTKLVLETSSPEQLFSDATFHLEKDDSGMLNLTTLSAYFAPIDWTAPTSFLEEERNLLESLSEDEKTWLSRIRRVALKEGKIIVRPSLPDQRRLLGEAADMPSKKVGWKTLLARHLVGL